MLKKYKEIISIFLSIVILFGIAYPTYATLDLETNSDMGILYQDFLDKFDTDLRSDEIWNQSVVVKMTDKGLVDDRSNSLKILGVPVTEIINQPYFFKGDRGFKSIIEREQGTREAKIIAFDRLWTSIWDYAEGNHNNSLSDKYDYQRVVLRDIIYMGNDLVNNLEEAELFLRLSDDEIEDEKLAIESNVKPALKARINRVYEKLTFIIEVKGKLALKDGDKYLDEAGNKIDLTNQNNGKLLRRVGKYKDKNGVEVNNPADSFILPTPVETPEGKEFRGWEIGRVIGTNSGVISDNTGTNPSSPEDVTGPVEVGEESDLGRVFNPGTEVKIKNDVVFEALWGAEPQLIVKKIDSENDKPLAGAKFKLYKETKVDGLEDLISENENVTVEINTAKELANKLETSGKMTEELRNQWTSINDKATKAGEKINELRENSKEMIGEYTTNSKGIVRFETLDDIENPDIKYTLEEVQAPEGYELEYNNIYEISKDDKEIVIKNKRKSTVEQTYSIYYDGNGNTSGSAPTDGNIYTSGETATVKGEGSLSKSGYNFLGWSTNKNASRAEYTEGDTIVISGDTTLYAVWDRRSSGGGGGGGGGSSKPDKPSKPEEKPDKPEEKPDKPAEKPSEVTPQKPSTPEEQNKVDRYKGGDRSERDDLLGMIIEEKIDYDLNKTDHLAYLKGYKDNTVRPEGNVTREEAAMVFYRLMEPEFRKEVETTDHSFTDVEAGRWSEKAIATLAKAEMITGYKDGSFKPTQKITRAEVSSMIAKLTDTIILPTDFDDIVEHWAEDYINSVEREGWIKGYEDGSFRPNDLIKRSEFTTMINSILERQVKKANILEGIKTFKDLEENKWYYEQMVEATNGHKYIIEDGIEIWTELDNRDFE